jgi:glc operon protein GlcG
MELPMRPTLALDVAKAIAAAAQQEARSNQWSVAIAIVDDAGRLQYFERMDGIANASVDIAIAKAEHAANFRRPTRYHEQLLSEGNNVVLGLRGMLPLEGGLPLEVGGQVIGGIGVSGVTSEQDGRIALAGARALLHTIST